MKILLDLFPIVVFFFVYKTYGINLAIIAMTLATILQILYTRFMSGKFEKMQVITLGLLIVFGGLTVWINDPAFIMWKVSVLYVAFALVLMGSLFTKTTILEKMLGKELKLTQQLWKKITGFWAVGFVLIAIVNGYFVQLALNSSELFFQAIGAEKSELVGMDCAQTAAIELCNTAQIAEANWVDFKLFGTMGLTFLLILITIVFVTKYNKNNAQL